MTNEWLQHTGEHDTPVYVRWFISGWCNYRCDYCFWAAHPRQGAYHTWRQAVRQPALLKAYLDRKHNRAHAFDNYPVEDWLAAFARLAPRATALNITGGEPFLDRANFHALLEGLTAMGHVKSIRIDTNVSWKTEHYRDIDWTKLSLNASYHPSQTTLERFTASVREKLDAGVRIVMANYVLDPRRLDHFADVEAAMRELGVFVNANVFIETRGIQQRAEARALYERYIPERDVKMKTGGIVPQGHPCRFPQFAYELKPTGVINTGCHPRRIGHFIKGPLPARFTGPSPCPYRYCACLDMYCFLEEARERGLAFDLLAEYAGLARAHRATAPDARGDT